ncbi:MAG: nucleotidyl transferase AbiEii/AbiGii toxin family protein [Actinomycetota bacterium]
MSCDASSSPELDLQGRVLAELSAAAAERGVSLLVIGAAARDILMTCLGLELGRATRDLDVAVAVTSMAQFEDLLGAFPRAAGRGSHSIVVHGLEVDVVPFGGVESMTRRIAFPDGFELDVLGVAEALGAAIRVTLPHGVTVRVPTFAAQAVLKLFAWRDRRYATSKDAIDLRAILGAGWRGGQLDRLYADEWETVERWGGDVVAASAAVLGREGAALLGPAGRAEVLEILRDPQLLEGLAGTAGSMAAEFLLQLDAFHEAFGERAASAG